MLAGDFDRKLRRLNRNLRIFCGDNDARPAGIFRVVRGEYREICGIDKHIIPEWSVIAPHGAHIKGGWRRTLKILINEGLIERQQAERLFRTRLHYKRPQKKRRDVNPENFYSSR